MDSIETIRQSVLDHEAPDRETLASQISQQQRRRAVMVLGMIVAAWLFREALASSGSHELLQMLLSGVLMFWSATLILGLAAQGLIKERYERRVLALVPAAELDEATRVVERLPGIEPVVDRWVRASGGLRRLEYNVLRHAGLALEQLDKAEAARKSDQEARSRLGRALDGKRD